MEAVDVEQILAAPGEFVKKFSKSHPGMLARLTYLSHGCLGAPPSLNSPDEVRWLRGIKAHKYVAGIDTVSPPEAFLTFFVSLSYFK